MKYPHRLRFASVPIACAIFAMGVAIAATRADTSAARYRDDSNGQDWPGYGRTFGQQHYSPLTQIDQKSIHRLGLAWSLELGPENSATQPIAVDGVLYFAIGLSVVHAVDARSGKLLWRYDPEVASKAGRALRIGWGVRGIAWWKGRIYSGSQDGRLIALDARTGKPAWSVQAVESDSGYCNGAPHAFDDKVIIGCTTPRGVVTAYAARIGKQIWRFYTVPGNPADGFENETMEKAAATWAGEWWRSGGGGSVWNAISYDAETSTVYVGSGSGRPWNRRERSADQGDNLFLASIVALDGRTGRYKWHYQVAPGDTWDFDAAMDIELADLRINGTLRKVLMQAPKNGFYYVIDRITGQLISAEPYTKVTWASRVDRNSGRPVEMPGSRYPSGTVIEIWPSALGAHSWMPMAYSPKTQFSYIPVIEMGHVLTDKGITLAERVDSKTAGQSSNGTNMIGGSGLLLAWNPVMQKAAWSVPHPTFLNGGLLATGGNLLFQGTVDGLFKAYNAATGKLVWSFDARAPLIATPISYAVNGRQYVTVLTGIGMGTPGLAGVLGDKVERYAIDPRSQARRVLTFALDGNAKLPAGRPKPMVVADPEFRPDARSAEAGEKVYGNCASCHGVSAIAAIHAPDLRRSAVPLSAEAFASVVRDGALRPNGMPDFPELTDRQLADLRQYIRTEATRLRDKETAMNPENK